MTKQCPTYGSFVSRLENALELGRFISYGESWSFVSRLVAGKSPHAPGESFETRLRRKWEAGTGLA